MFLKLLTLLLSYSNTCYNNLQDNLNYIKNHENSSYELGINQFITRHYYHEYYNKSKSFIKINITNGNPLDSISYNPHQFDWREHNAVSSVKNQQQCGSCWAFSSVESIEGAWAIKHNKLYNLSEQQLVDCSQSYGNNGCNGGNMDFAFNYVIDNGICTNKSYPYTAQDMGQCNQSCNKVVSISNYTNVLQNNEHTLEKAVLLNPVSVAIQGNKRSFQLYKSGIYNDLECGYELDHGVLLVGYGKENKQKYWIVKNSWGSDWGENGYIRILKNINDTRGLCGIAMMPSFPVI